MPKIIAFEIEIGGVKEIFNNFDEVKSRVKLLKKEFDTSDFGSEKYKQSQLALAKLTKAQADATAQTRLQKQEIEASNKSQEGSYRQLNAQLVVLRSNYKDLSEIDRNGAPGRGLVQNITLLDSKLKNIDKGIGLFQRNVGNYLGALNSFTAQAGNSIGGVAGGLISGIGSIGSSATLGAPAAILATVAVAGGAVKEVISLDAQISDLQANIQKTANLNADQVRELTNSLKDLDTRTTLNELLNIGKVLGQFGIEVNTNTIKAIDKLNVALGDEFKGGAEEITTVVGKLRNVFTEFASQSPEEAFLHIGNAINQLGATGAATGPVIADFATRLAGQLGVFGVSAGNILGISATLEELGVNVERGATGIAKAFQAMLKKPKEFQEVLKITDEVVQKSTNGAYKNFTELLNKDLYGAFEVVLGQVDKLNLSNVQFQAVLGKLGIKQQGAIEVIAKLASKQELLASRTQLASESITEQSSINKEFALVNNNLAGELEKLANSMKNAFVNTGITDGLAGLLKLINGTQEGVVSLESATRKQAESFSALTRIALDNNTTQEKRLEIIQGLIKEYPSYFGSLTAEQVSNEKLKTVLAEVNDFYKDRLKLLIQLDKGNNASALQNQAEDKAFQAEKQLLIEIDRKKQALQENGFIDTGNTRNDIANVSKIVKRTDKNIFGDLSFVNNNDLRNALNEYYKTQRNLNNAKAENTKVTAENAKEVVKLFELDGKVNKQALIDIGIFAEKSTIARKEIDALNDKKDVVKAQNKLDELSANGKKILNKLDLETLKNYNEIAKQVGNKSLFALTSKAISDINIANKNTGKLVANGTTADLGLGGGSGKIKSEKDFLTSANNASEQYLQARLKALERFKNLYDQAQIKQIDDEREQAIEAEKKKAKDIVNEIDKTNADILAKQAKNIKDLDKDIKDSKGKGQYQELLKKRNEELKQNQSDNIELEAKGNEAKIAINDASLKNIDDINKKYDKIEVDRQKKRWADNLSGYNQYYKALLDAVDTNQQKVNLGLLKSKNDELQGANGDKGLIQKINLKYDISGLKATENSIEAQIKITDAKIKNAQTVNLLNSFLGIEPAIQEKSIQEFQKTLDDLKLKLAESVENRRTVEINASADTYNQKLEDQKKFNELVVDQSLNLSNELANVFANNESQRLSDEKDARLSLLEDEYKKKLELAKGNANEEERVNAELATKKLAIEKKYQEQQRQIAKKQAIIAGALGVLQIFASPTPDIFSKLILAGALAIKTAFQVDAINKQKFAGGGKVGTFGGNSHQYGGTKGYFSDGTQIEVEADEDFFIINKRNSHLRRQLSRLNSFRSNGRSFAEGGSVFGENLYRQQSQQASSNGNVTVVIPEYQMAVLANMVAKATESGTRQGTQSGIANGERINERYSEFKNRTNR